MRYLLFILVLLTGAEAYAAPRSAWPNPRRKWMLVPGVYYYRANSYWQADRTVSEFGEDGRFTSVNVRLYATYGLTDRLTLVGTLPFQDNRSRSRLADNRHGGLSDAELGLRYNLVNVENRRYLSVQALAVAPLYRNGSRQPYLGYAQAGAELRALYAGSTQIGSKNAYFNTELGYRRFFKGSGEYGVNQVSLLATMGWYASKNSVLVGELSGLVSYSNRFRALNPANPTVNTDFRFLKASFSYGRKLSESTWLYAGVYQDIYGKNVGIGRGFSVTSVIRF